MSDWNAAVELAARIVETDATWPLTGKSKQIATTIRLLKRPADQEGWMPIESAPKDGNKILLADYSGHPPHLWIASGSWLELENTALGRGHWTDGVDWLYTPTHWRPLPSAPTPEAK